MLLTTFAGAQTAAFPAQDRLAVAVRGVLELGSNADSPDSRTGFVSLVRIVDADVRTLR